jgi:hypothetical protein
MEKPKPLGKTEQKILDYLTPERGQLSAWAIATGLGLTRDSVDGALRRLWHRGEVLRSRPPTDTVQLFQRA